MAFATVIGLAAGTTAVTATTVMLAVAEVGMAMSVAGMVTGDKELTKIGGTMSLIGGVGGAIAGAAATSEASSLLSSQGFGAGGAEQIASEVATEGAANLGAEAVAGVEAAPVADVAPVAELDAAAAPMTPEIPVAAPTPVNQIAAPTAPTDIAANPATDGLISSAQAGPPTGAESAADAGALNQTLSPYEQATQPTQTANAVTGDTSTAQAWTNGSGLGKDTLSNVGANVTGKVSPSDNFWSKMADFIKQNDKVTSVGMQLVGSGLSGIQKQKQFDQQYALQAQRQAWGNSVPNMAPRSLIASAKV